MDDANGFSYKLTVRGGLMWADRDLTRLEAARYVAHIGGERYIAACEKAALDARPRFERVGLRARIGPIATVQEGRALEVYAPFSRPDDVDVVVCGITAPYGKESTEV